MGAGGAMQIIQKYAIIILRRSTASQASSNVSQENTNHLNGIYSDLTIINILLQTGVQHSYATSHQHLTSNRFLISLTGMPLMFLGFGKDVMRKIRISV